MGATWEAKVEGEESPCLGVAFGKVVTGRCLGVCGEGKASNVFDLIRGGPTGLAGEDLSLPKQRETETDRQN